jgi:CRP-like cAMP-binding protein
VRLNILVRRHNREVNVRRLHMDLSAKTQLLKQVPYFGSLPLGRVRELAAGLPERHYHAGDVIARKGDRCEGLCIVLSGRVRTVITSEEGREQVLKVFGPGRTFGDIPVFDDEPNPADAVAVTESTIAVVPQAEILDLLRRHPDLCIDVIRLFASRLRAYKQVIEDLALRTVVARVARLLVDHTRGTHTLVEESANRRLDYTQDEIAAMVGSVREVVQRALKALEHAGLVESERGRIHVIDVEALSTWTEQTAVRPPRSPVAASR